MTGKTNTIIGDFSNLYDLATGALIGFIRPDGHEQLLSELVLPTTAPVILLTDYTLTEADDQKIFVAGAPIIITIPELSRPPACRFVPQLAGSITLHPGTANVLVDGSNGDVLRSTITDPSGFGFIPNYGTANSYSTTTNSASFGSLSGIWTDNASLLAGVNSALALKSNIRPVPLKLSGGLTLSASNAGPGIDTHMNGFIFVNSSAVDRTVTINTGIRTDFVCDFARGPTNVGNLVFAFGAGVTVFTKGSLATARLASGGTSARLVCTGTQDQFFLISDDLTV